jgi:hypothetical protein
MNAGLLSPRAMRLLELLTPEPVPISAPQAENPVVEELMRLGLVTVGWTNVGKTICLSRRAQSFRPSAFN